jgi:hypothetical protein
MDLYDFNLKSVVDTKAMEIAGASFVFYRCMLLRVYRHLVWSLSIQKRLVPATCYVMCRRALYINEFLTKDRSGTCY